MPETKYILILANSIRPGGHCVAGKMATPLANGLYDVSERWIRLVDPKNSKGGVPYECTLCQGTKPVRPLDIIKVVLLESCGNPDHPEDWYFDRSQSWQVESNFAKRSLPAIMDTPATLWHDGIASNAVSAGFLRTMKPHPFSICLISAPAKMDFSFWKKPFRDHNTGQDKTKYVRDLSFNRAGIYHEFSVTDPEFMKRHKIWDRMTEMPQIMRITDTSNYFLCLSLGLAFNERQYKISATIFEP
ncbi:MAG: dual OB domain-containing protein [Limisphaerales bacterium]